MVRLVTLISEKQLQPTGTKIVNYGLASTPGVATLSVGTKLHSVRNGWAGYFGATLYSGPLPMINATAGSTLYINGLSASVSTPDAYVAWFAVGDA